MTRKEIIEHKLRALNPHFLEVEDVSASHAGHLGNPNGTPAKKDKTSEVITAAVANNTDDYPVSEALGLLKALNIVQNKTGKKND